MVVCAPTGRIHHADDGFLALTGRDDVLANGFDMIPANVAAEAGKIIGDLAGKPIRTWFPYVDRRGGRVWCRFEVSWPGGLIAMAVWPEADAARHRIHWEPLPEEA